MATFLDELLRVQTIHDEREKKEVSEILQDFLAEDPTKIQQITRIVLGPLFRLNLVSGLKQLMNDNKAVLSSKIYIDDDYSTKVSIRGSIIPEPNNTQIVDETFSKIVASIKDMNLDLVINDVVVNENQWRSE